MSIIEKQRRITKIPEEYLNEVLKAPKSVKIELTGRCNYRCKFCPLSIRDKQPTEDMDWGFFKKITKELKELGVEEIGVFYIGESFINPKLLRDAIYYLKQDLKYPYVFLTSNASLAKKSKVEECMKAGLDSLKWSCNAYSPTQYSDMLGVPKEMMGVALKNIRDAWEVRNAGGYKCKLTASSIKYDDDQYAKMNEFRDKEIKPYVDDVYWLPLYTAGGQTIENTGYRPTPGNTGTIDEPVDPLPCWTVFTEGHIMVDGRMSACCLDSMGKWAMGDLKKNSFMEIWNNDKYVELRKAHLNKNVNGTVCEKCAMYS